MKPCTARKSTLRCDFDAAIARNMKTTLQPENRLVGAVYLTLAALVGPWVGNVRAADANAPSSQVAATNAPAQQAASTNATPAAEKKVKESEESSEPKEYRNWVTLGVGGIWREGDKGAFSQATGLPSGAYGGIDSLHYEQDVGQRGIFKFDGRGIFNNDDYLVRLELSDPEKGFIRGGYREFRTWSDGSGGYSPAGMVWVEPYDDQLHLDRGDAWVELGLTLPNVPQATVRYDHLFRDGKKDSTIWGEYNITGVGLRGIVPTFLDIDETRDIIRGDVRHTVGKWDLGAGIRYEHADQDNSRNIRLRPGEPGDRYITQKDDVSSDLLNVHAFTETRFSENVLFTTAYSWTTFHTDVGGSRIYGDQYDADFNVPYPGQQSGDRGFLNLHGGQQYHQNVGNLNLMWTPISGLAVVPSVRVEGSGWSGDSAYTAWTVSSPTSTATETPMSAANNQDNINVSESLELRYSGVTNWVFYGRGYWLEGQDQWQENELTITNLSLFRDTDLDRFFQKYTAGANWYPFRKLTLGGQYYFKRQNYDYTHSRDSTDNSSGNRYPAYLENQAIQTHDANVRATWRALPNLTFTARYDYQLVTIDSQWGQLADLESGLTRSHIFSGSLSWVPWSKLYLQVNGTYTTDHTGTPANRLPGISPQLVADFDSDYWTVGGMAGYILSDKTDLQASYYYFNADNYVPYLVTQPYGAGLVEQTVTAGILHRFTSRVQGTVKFSFVTSDNQTSGGHNDFSGYGIYSTMQYLF